MWVSGLLLCGSDRAAAVGAGSWVIVPPFELRRTRGRKDGWPSEIVSPFSGALGVHR